MGYGCRLRTISMLRSHGLSPRRAPLFVTRTTALLSRSGCSPTPCGAPPPRRTGRHTQRVRQQQAARQGLRGHLAHQGGGGDKRNAGAHLRGAVLVHKHYGRHLAAHRGEQGAAPVGCGAGRFASRGNKNVALFNWFISLFRHQFVK